LQCQPAHCASLCFASFPRPFPGTVRTLLTRLCETAVYLRHEGCCAGVGTCRVYPCLLFDQTLVFGVGAEMWAGRRRSGASTPGSAGWVRTVMKEIWLGWQSGFRISFGGAEILSPSDDVSSTRYCCLCYFYFSCNRHLHGA